MISDKGFERLRTEILALKALSDIEWGHNTICQEPSFEKLERKEREALIIQAMDCAQEQYRLLIEKHGHKLPSQYAELYGIRIETDNSIIASPFLYFATYTPNPPVIRLATDAFSQIYTLLNENSEFSENFPGISLSELAIAHELFHHISELDPSLFVCQKNLKVSMFFGLINYKIVSRSLDEIAGRYFSKLAMGLDFYPTVYEHLLLYSDRQRKNNNKYHVYGRINPFKK